MKKPEKTLKLLPYCFIVLLPFIYLFTGGIIYAIKNKVDLINFVFPSGRRIGIYLNSVFFSFSVAALDTFLGIWAASFLWRLNSPFLCRLRWLTVAFAILPPYIHAMAWSKLFGRLAISFPLFFSGLSRGWFITIAVQTMALLPAATALILSGLLPIEENMIASGQVLAKDPKVWWRIVLPTAAPQIISTTGLIFLLSFCDYTIPSLFSINVYAVEPFVEYSSSYNVFRALFTSLPLLVPSVFVFFFSMKNVRKLFLMKREQYVLKSLFQWGLPLRLIQVTSFFILISGAAVLLIVMLFNIEVFKQVPMVISSSTSDIAYTLMISLLASLISLVLCALAAKALNELKNPGILWSIILLPFAIPAPLVGTAIIALFNHPIKLMQFLYNSMLMPVLACTVRFSPVGVLIFSSYLVRLDYSAIEAAGILSGNRIRILFNISFPMLMPAFILTFLSVFFLSIGELGATVMLLPPGMGTLTLKIYNYLHYGANERVMALCLIIVSIVMLPGLLIVILSSKSKKRSGCGFD